MVYKDKTVEINNIHILIKNNLIIKKMKTNKKAIFGFATAMIFSMALMQGISKKDVEQKEMSLQQVAGVALYMSAETEGGESAVWKGVAGAAGVVAGRAFFGGAMFGWNPGGWAALGIGVVATL
jgi:hypothetical protein